MTQYTMTDARGHFAEILDSVEKTHDRVAVTRNGRVSAVLISPDDLESLEETIAILSDPEAMAAIRQGEEDFARGDYIEGDEALEFLKKIAAKKR